MSKWMSIGFDPGQMDPVTESDMRAAVGRVQDDADPRQSGGLDQASPASLEPSAA